MDNKKKIAIVGAAFLMYSLSKKKDKIAIDNIVDSLEKHPTKTFTKRNTGQIDRIILHHYAGMGTPQAVAHYHVKPDGRNWPGIGYHYTINQDGTISQTNYHDTISYHVSGENYRSIGIAMEGDFTSIPPTAAQIISLNLLIPHIRTQFSQPLEVYQHSDFANKPYDANMDLTPYKLASISAIYKEGNPNLTMCQDGTYTDSYAGGTCSHHGGFYNELDSISDSELEAYFYKEYLIGDYMRANKINISDFKRYGDRNLIREKLHWIQKEATPLDSAAQSLSWQIGATVTPQDLINIVMDYPSPKAYIDDMKYQLLEMQKRQQGMFGINAIQKNNKCPEFTECSDGTYSTKKGRGTCSGHGGVLVYGKEKKKPTAKAAQKQPFKKGTQQVQKKPTAKAAQKQPFKKKPVQQKLKEILFIKFFNKDKNYREDIVEFENIEAARKWAKNNLDNYKPDMIKYKEVELDYKIAQPFKKKTIVKSAKEQPEPEPKPETKPEPKDITLIDPSKTPLINVWNLILKTYRFEWNNVSQLYQGFKAAYDLRIELYDFLKAKTKKILLNYLYQISPISYAQYKNENKPDIIKTILHKLYISFSNSKDGFITVSDNLAWKDPAEYMNKRIKTEWTEANYQAGKKLYREKNTAQLKAVENPETLEEFKKAEKKRELTEQEKQLYLELQEKDLLKLAERIRERTIKEKEAKRIKNAAAKAVDADTDFIVKESIHTKTGDTLYLVEPTNRVDKDTYRQLLSRAKKLGGFWSRWDKAFRFPSIEIANQFANIKQEVKKEEEAQEKDTWTKFRESAAKIETKADNIINADRKVNTSRRMRMAQGVIQDAENRIYFASLLRALADMQQDGSATFLNWLQFQTELEMLINLESFARQDYLRTIFDNSSRLSYSDQLQEVRNLPLDLRFREYIKPGICLQVHHWKRFAEDGKSVAGAKQFSKTILKYIKGRKENELFCLPTHYYSNLQTALKKVIKNSYSHTYLQETFTNAIRLQKLGLDNKDVLFAALKELQKVKELAAEKYEHEKITKIDFELETLRQSKDAQKTFDYFATPDTIAKEVVMLADIEPGARVLEPSAGDGQLIRAVREEQPTATIDAIEKQYRLQGYLKKQGFNVVASELETFNPDYKYDAIVMNPPFSNRQDAEHIMKAYSLLKPGGKLVAIMSEGTFNASDKKSKALQNLYLQAGIYDKKLIGVFKEMGTNVNTRLIVLEGIEGISGLEEPKRSNKIFAIGTLATIFYLAAKQKSNAKN